MVKSIVPKMTSKIFFKIFADSIFFTFGVALIGIAIIAFGVQYQKYRTLILRTYKKMIPKTLWALFPAINEDSVA